MIGRIAVSKEFRGKQYSEKMLQCAERAAIIGRDGKLCLVLF